MTAAPKFSDLAIKGSLTVVGTGIMLMGQTTLESEAAIKAASKLFYLVTDPVTRSWLEELNPTGEDLWRFYEVGKQRIETYEQIVDHIVDAVRSGESVCVAFYGHPGVFVHPGHEAIRICRSEGYPAAMLPGVSADACLYADLNLDPAHAGLQSIEATDFLISKRTLDENVTLILWQISVIGIATYERANSRLGLETLSARLAERYGPDHEVVIYEAARYPVCPHVAHRTTIRDLPDAPISGISTLVVPPKGIADVDVQMVEALQLPPGSRARRRSIDLGFQAKIGSEPKVLEVS